MSGAGGGRAAVDKASARSLQEDQGYDGEDMVCSRVPIYIVLSFPTRSPISLLCDVRINLLYSIAILLHSQKPHAGSRTTPLPRQGDQVEVPLSRQYGGHTMTRPATVSTRGEEQDQLGRNKGQLQQGGMVLRAGGVKGVMYFIYLLLHLCGSVGPGAPTPDVLGL